MAQMPKLRFFVVYMNTHTHISYTCVQSCIYIYMYCLHISLRLALSLSLSLPLYIYKRITCGKPASFSPSLELYLLVLKGEWGNQYR